MEYARNLEEELMTIVVLLLLFLATIFIWPETIYRMDGDTEGARKLTGILFAVISLIAVYAQVLY